MDEKLNTQLQQLNALVDGELEPSERAALAARIAIDRNLARAHATLALLKATVIEQGEIGAESTVAVPRQRGWRPAAAYAALLMFAVIAGLALMPANVTDPVLNRERTILTLASLPSGVAMPSLDRAGLQLVDVAVDSVSGETTVTANYRGSHGCRLEFRAKPVHLALPPLAGTSRREWQVGAMGYEMVAHGMPEPRFGIIAEAAERQTRESGMPALADKKLREARVGAPPCAG